MAAWAAEDMAVARWARNHVPVGSEGSAPAGAVLAWAHLHGAVGLAVAGQFQGRGHDGGTLLTAQIEALADAFGLG